MALLEHFCGVADAFIDNCQLSANSPEEITTSEGDVPTNQVIKRTDVFNGRFPECLLRKKDASPEFLTDMAAELPA